MNKFLLLSAVCLFLAQHAFASPAYLSPSNTDTFQLPLEIQASEGETVFTPFFFEASYSEGIVCIKSLGSSPYIGKWNCSFDLEAASHSPCSSYEMPNGWKGRLLYIGKGLSKEALEEAAFTWEHRDFLSNAGFMDTDQMIAIEFTLPEQARISESAPDSPNLMRDTSGQKFILFLPLSIHGLDCHMYVSRKGELSTGPGMLLGVFLLLFVQAKLPALRWKFFHVWTTRKREQIEFLISQDRATEAIVMLKKRALHPTFSHQRETLICLNARLNRIKKAEIAREASIKEVSIERAKISKALIDTLT